MLLGRHPILLLPAPTLQLLDQVGALPYTPTLHSDRSREQIPSPRAKLPLLRFRIVSIASHTLHHGECIDWIPFIFASAVRASPQKAQRTYDNKLISREFDRLGMQFQSGSSSTLVATASASTLSLTPTIIPITESRSTPLLGSTSTLSIPSSSQDSPWTSLHLQVLPLFNGEPLHAPIEDLNQLVRQHIQIVLSVRLIFLSR
jgi:HbrB-like